MRKLTVKERVVEAALDLFQEKGYHGVSVEELVEHAETSKGGFYHHFKSKDDLLYEIHDIFISYVLNETKRASEQYDSAIDQLDALMRTFMNVFNIYQRHITVFYNESVYLLPNHEEAITKKRTAYRKLLEQILINGQRQQVFRQELSITITAMLIIGTVNWTYKWYKQDGELTMQDITTYFNDVILRGVMTEAGYREAATKQYLL
ncbi:TetR family transcriptional regulator [Kurthia sp. 3B1D]|uniref:TetR family transcriptional regulator n=2 Tax=Kurthia TaxID=1649 RepID=A0A433RXN2_9BACL|nr:MULTISPECIES: TetR/AcrR family transcriptional regulator [unclassified Kurthia]RUS58066.1 TetR family transcriptional regulator [Kurthia sp. 3B1D]